MAAFEHPDVVALVDEVLANPSLLPLATRAFIFKGTPSRDAMRGLIRSTFWGDDELAPAAERIVTRGMSIASAPLADDRRRRRGAILERLVHSLVAQRVRVGIYREHEIELTHNRRSRKQWTDPKETVVDGRPFEVYECKSDGLPVLEDIDQLSDVVTTARAEGTDCRAAIAIFGSDTQLSILARGWRLSEEIHGYATSQLFELAAGPPDRPLTPRLGPGTRG